jgi:hypothetical protein
MSGDLRQIYEMLRNGDFEAVLSRLDAMKTAIDGMQTLVSAIRGEVRGTSEATSEESFVGVIHSPARIDPSTQTSIEKLVGDYFVGDPELSGDPQHPSQSGRMIFGPTSELIVSFMASKAEHVVSKRYVDNIMSPLYSKVLALADPNARTVTCAFYFNSASDNNDFTLGEQYLRSGSADHNTYFSMNQTNLRFNKAGVYLLSIFISAKTFVGTGNMFVVNLDGVEVAHVDVNAAAPPIILPIYVRSDSILSWAFGGSATGITFGLSLVKLGDA